MEIQEYPSGWIHDSDAPWHAETISSDLEARTLILYGINDEGALELLGEDRPVHGCFHQSSLLEMLLRMMFWNELDGMLSTKCVPRRYYVTARAKLDSLLENDEHPDL
ncbi:hypothetical protein PHMEG_00026442 [Phytophthora megakarya]|uniref:Uncharacterized protein n=1 Tax=Phytophthora megakarya TaxID=4795 RepID=A0A225V9K5_9STRA|nr:hypothetical protein PHMEG_00026442 [Phytophthora megakarya]